MPNSLYLVTNPNRRIVPASDLLVMAGRKEQYRWELLDLSGGLLGSLDGVTGGEFEYSSDTTLRASGSLTYERSNDVDWLHVLVRATYRATFPEGSVLEWPLGVFIPASPSASYGDGQSSRDVELQSLLQILDEDAVDQTYALAAGAAVIPAVRALITGAGVAGKVPLIAGTDSDESLRSALVWEAGTSRLRIINDLLAAINYFSLWVDGQGTYRLDPYVPPAQRGSAWDFLDDEFGIASPDFTHTRDLFAVPNKVVGIAQGSGDAPALVSTATNVDEASPFSFPSRGRWITRVETNIEATSQAVLDGIVARRLSELSQVSSSVEVSHWPVLLTPNDVTTFRREHAGINLRGVVQKTSIDCTPGSLARTTIREVTT